MTVKISLQANSYRTRHMKTNQYYEENLHSLQLQKDSRFLMVIH